MSLMDSTGPGILAIGTLRVSGDQGWVLRVPCSLSVAVIARRLRPVIYRDFLCMTPETHLGRNASVSRSNYTASRAEVIYVRGFECPGATA